MLGLREVRNPFTFTCTNFSFDHEKNTIWFNKIEHNPEEVEWLEESTTPSVQPIDGEQKLKVGDLVMLDREFNNAGPVRLIRLDKYYSTVSDGGSTWDVMSNRLSIITPAPEAQPIDQATGLDIEDAVKKLLASSTQNTDKQL